MKEYRIHKIRAATMLFTFLVTLSGIRAVTEVDETLISTTMVSDSESSHPEDVSTTTEESVTGVYDSRLKGGCEAKVVQELVQNGHPDQTLGLGSSVDMWEAVVVYLVVGVISALIAYSFHAVRKHVYHDSSNLDTAFDAGGNVSISLTASCIVSNWTWTATLLQSCTVAAKYGISGPYWYAGGATIQIIIFAILSIQLKIRAPGAKTFLQVIRARFGKVAHLVFCGFALVTNIIIVTALMVAGVAVIKGLVSELSADLAAFLLAVVVGTYTIIGGLGATFYVAYFNTALIYILICWLVIEVFHNPSENPRNPFGSSKSIYELLVCWEGPEGNKENSYLTFYSSGGLVFGIVNIVGNFGAVFCDQAYWQKSVASKPLHGVWGFVLGAVSWFAVPFALATTMGLSYLALNAAHGQQLLTDNQVDSGLVAAFVSQKLLGKMGEFIIIILILMAVMATGASEVIAVASIVVYDIYQVYLKPFRHDLKEGQCILCGCYIHPPKELQPTLSALCKCPAASNCEGCKTDEALRKVHMTKFHYQCSVHKDYREYLDELLTYKNWWIIIGTFLSVVFTLLAWYAKLNLSWLYYFIGVLISAAVLPIAFSITWARVTALGMTVGSLGGFLCAIISWLSYASTLPGGLENFIQNTGDVFSMFVGNVVSILSGGFICALISIVSKPHWTAEELEAEWDKTRNIDNPLNPWVQAYQDDLKLEDVKEAYERPPLELVVHKFRKASLTAYIVAICLTVFFIIVWPASMMLGVTILDEYGFMVWTTISRGWAYVATAFIVLVPVIQEIVAIFQQVKKNRMEGIDNPKFPHKKEVSIIGLDGKYASSKSLEIPLSSRSTSISTLGGTTDFESEQ